MEYRKLPHGEEQISILGLGTSSIQAAGEQEIEETVAYALSQGINFFDMASSEAKPFAAYGRALEGRRRELCAISVFLPIRPVWFIKYWMKSLSTC